MEVIFQEMYFIQQAVEVKKQSHIAKNIFLYEISRVLNQLLVWLTMD